MRKLKFLENKGFAKPGMVLDVPDEQAKSYVARNFAIDVTEEEKKKQKRKIRETKTINQEGGIDV